MHPRVTGSFRGSSPRLFSPVSAQKLPKPEINTQRELPLYFSPTWGSAGTGLGW